MTIVKEKRKYNLALTSAARLTYLCDWIEANVEDENFDLGTWLKESGTCGAVFFGIPLDILGGFIYSYSYESLTVSRNEAIARVRALVDNGISVTVKSEDDNIFYHRVKIRKGDVLYDTMARDDDIIYETPRELFGTYDHYMRRVN